MSRQAAATRPPPPAGRVRAVLVGTSRMSADTLNMQPHAMLRIPFGIARTRIPRVRASPRGVSSSSRMVVDAADTRFVAVRRAANRDRNKQNSVIPRVRARRRDARRTYSLPVRAIDQWSPAARAMPAAARNATKRAGHTRLYTRSLLKH
jgi:hypothetical protein